LNRLVASASSDATALERLKTNVDQLRQSVGTANKELAEQAGQVMQLLGKAFDTTIQQKVLNSLCFEGMTTRFEMVEEAHLDTFKWMFDASDFVYDAPLESIRSLFGEPALDGDLDDAWDSEWGSEDEGNHEADGGIGDENSEDENSEPKVEIGDGQYSKKEYAEDDTEDWNAEDEDEEDDDNDGADGTGLPLTMISTGRKVPSAYDSGLTKRSIKVKFTTGKGFIEWLSSSDGIFHISGKMGSGKSTMMRFLYEHPATRYELNRWAGKYSKIMEMSA
jgi:Cu/Ag efflux protein CusF